MGSIWLGSDYVAPVRRVDGGIRACTHLAQIRIGTQLKTGYVKAFDASNDRLLFNEVAGGVLAQEAGIGAPPGGLLWVPLQVLRALFPGRSFGSHNGMVPCYASAPVDDGHGLAAIGLAQSTGNVLNEIVKHLLAWPGFAACVAFDEWVGNVDRHSNNLLLKSGGQIVPIDHSDCFGGPLQDPDDFTRPQAWYLNRLLDQHFEPDRLSLPIKASLVHAAERMVSVYSRCAIDLEALRPWLGEPAGLNWLSWVWKRSEIVVQLVRERVRLLV